MILEQYKKRALNEDSFLNRLTVLAVDVAFVDKSTNHDGQAHEFNTDSLNGEHNEHS